MKLPVDKLILPQDLKNAQNGNIPQDLLIPLDGGGQLHWIAAWHYTRLKGHAAQDGISLTYSPGGTYRTFEAQRKLFSQRFEPGFKLGGTNRLYEGRWWHLRPNMALAATPGKSNHGYGLAIDLALGDSPQTCKPLNKEALNWLLWCIKPYGFSWEAQSEPWHIRYNRGVV